MSHKSQMSQMSHLSQMSQMSHMSHLSQMSHIGQTQNHLRRAHFQIFKLSNAAL
jgi:flagellar hook assembly protein FlgD